MLNLDLSRDLKTLILSYIYQTHTTTQLQTELTKFMTQISPVYKRKVTKEMFKELISMNRVLMQIKDTHLELKRKFFPRSFTPARKRLQESKETDKCITQLVSKLESIFTSPDVIYLQQEDDSKTNQQAQEGEDDDRAVDDEAESFMYFVRKGKFSIEIKTDHLSNNMKQKVI